MTKVSQEVKDALMKDYPVFEEANRQFYAKELPANKYKGISGGFGSYAERGYETGMIRYRFPGGLIERDQVDFLLNIVDEYKLTDVHFTTGQNIQFHRLSGPTILEMYKAAAEHGIYCRGGGGDFPRNIAASPLRGVEDGEFFDISPYVTAASQYILTLVTTLQLPRKYKIGFSSGVDNEGHATFKDLGFLAKANGKFDVYAAGGLGPNPRFGVQVATDVAPEDILFHIHAMGHLFSENGDYKNRAHNRTRYLPADMGDDVFRDLYNKYLEKSKAEDLRLPTLTAEELPAATSQAKPANSRVKAQRQAGYYYVHYHPLAGLVPVDVWVKLLELVKASARGEIRLNTDESAYIVNLSAEEADQLAALTEDTHGKNAFERSVSCVGATVCQVGIQDSRGLLATLVENLRAKGVNTDVLPQMHISGCPSSCGTHQIGSLGFHGFVKRVGTESVPAFKVFVGGAYDATKEKMGQEVGLLTVENIEVLLTALAEELSKDGKSFAEWYQEEPEAFAAIVEELA